MIWESSYWKEDLIAIAGRMTSRSSQKRWTERSLVNIEKDVFLSFYIVRKLIEAKKITNELENKTFKIQAYPSTGKPVTLLNWHHLDKLYEFSKGAYFERSLVFLCNQLVHSYVFSVNFSDDGKTLFSFLFSSDRERNKFLYELPISMMIEILKDVGSNYPTDVKMHYNEDRQDYDTFRG